MILRLSDSLSRGLLVAVALLIGLWLSFFGIRAAIARYYSEEDTAKCLESAVRLESGNPEYWYGLGRYQQYNLEQPDAALAEQSYRKAIALNPVATEAWLDLGTAYELDGKTEEARAAYLQGKKSYPVSAEVSWRYGNFLLREGREAQAYAELRRAIEADPKRAAAAFSRAYRVNSNIEQILNELLPPQPSAYVEMINEAVSEGQLGAAKAIWDRLLTLHPRLAMRDFEQLVAELLGAGEYDDARRVWDQGTSTMNLPPLLEPRGSVVWDPSFESNLNGYSFSWQFKPIVQGVSIGFDSAEKHSGSRSLRLAFDGEHNPDLEAACTVAVVQPSTIYRFSGWIKTKDVTTIYGVGFRIHSYGRFEPPAVNTKQIYGNNPFTMIEQTWTTGPDIRRAVICVTREASDNPGVRISGTAWVDDVNLVPEPAEPNKP
jgi:DNA-binding SARP family transcriptional activator